MRVVSILSFPKSQTIPLIHNNYTITPCLCFAVRCEREDLFQEYPQQHQVQHQAVSQEDP